MDSPGLRGQPLAVDSPCLRGQPLAVDSAASEDVAALGVDFCGQKSRGASVVDQKSASLSEEIYEFLYY